ncbi:class I SAM-dependent methyltransferase [Streptomyces sp. NPDC054884]|uniref:class I SAM-dependent methyltransferase n=1 Tax=Streptomyces sp. ME08-AFT2 TaxID=3028683 RepID=UPI0029A9289E|nr:class I SAM-dependent methyltransferase [Streptomyces sp. ME08-AFT2]MDX3311866.1 class I SAM-dependent methyltransferase [Streptomyces sp. ME08-AFT2]
MTSEDDGQRAARVFDALGPAYEKAFAHSEAHRRSLDWLLGRLTPDSDVLDVGSGTGRPTAATLAAAGHSVLGVDVSPVMVDLAARQVPNATFRCVDVRRLPLRERSLHAACAYFSLLQMERAQQAELIGRLAGALLPGGSLALATVPVDVEGVDAVFMGQPVRVTSYARDGLVDVVTAAGLTVLDEESVLFTPAHPEAGPEPHLFLHCGKP